MNESCIQTKGTMAEWSKAIDLRSIIFGCAGSNPAGTINKKSYSNYISYI